MKRYGNLFEKICSMENLQQAHYNARRDKQFYHEVKMVDLNPNYYLSQIQDMLINKTYKVSPYKKQMIMDNKKERELMKLPYFPDRIIQWAIMLQIEPIFMKTFTNFSCASIPQRGIHKAWTYTNRYLRKDKEGTKYCLKMDIHHFYPSVNHSILKQLLRKKFKDNDLLELLDKIIDSYPKEVGIPIGSYLSQYFGNFYLTYFDHWLKEQMGVKYVIRYMDDVVILHSSKSFLSNLRKEITKYLDINLKLELKSNWQIFPVAARGIDFVGYRFYGTHTLVRKSIFKRMKKTYEGIMKIDRRNTIKDFNYEQFCAINSYRGWLQWCDSFHLYIKYIVPIWRVVFYFYDNKVCKKKGAKQDYARRRYRKRFTRSGSVCCCW